MSGMSEKKNKWKYVAVALVIVLAVICVVYLYFTVQSSINSAGQAGYYIGYTDGINYTISTMLTQIQQTGRTGIVIGNQTLYLKLV